MALLFTIWLALVLLLWRQHRAEKLELLRQLQERCDDLAMTLDSMSKGMARIHGEKGRHPKSHRPNPHGPRGFDRSKWIEEGLKGSSSLPEAGFPLQSRAARKHFFGKFLEELVQVGQFEELFFTDQAGDVVLTTHRPSAFEGQDISDGRMTLHPSLPLCAMPKPLNAKVWSHLGYRRFVAVMSTDNMERRLAQGFQLRLALALGSFLVLAMCFAFFKRRQRSLILSAQLEEKNRINRDLEEKQLAAAGLAHETRTPLGVVRGLAQLQSEQPELPEAMRQRALAMVDEVDRITSRLNDFIEYAKMREPKWENVDCRQLFERLGLILSDDLQESEVDLVFPREDCPKVSADEDMLQQVFFNLFHNAIEVCPAQSSIRVHWTVQRGKLDFIVEDNGPGIPEALLDTVLAPYVTSREGGTGLGLAVCHQICQRHGVVLEVSNLEGGGACFAMRGFQLAS